MSTLLLLAWKWREADYVSRTLLIRHGWKVVAPVVQKTWAGRLRVDVVGEYICFQARRGRFLQGLAPWLAVISDPSRVAITDAEVAALILAYSFAYRRWFSWRRNGASHSRLANGHHLCGLQDDIVNRPVFGYMGHFALKSRLEIHVRTF